MNMHERRSRSSRIQHSLHSPADDQPPVTSALSDYHLKNHCNMPFEFAHLGSNAPLDELSVLTD